MHSQKTAGVVTKMVVKVVYLMGIGCRHHLAFSAPANVTAAKIAGGERKEIAGVRGSFIDTGPVLYRTQVVWRTGGTACPNPLLLNKN